MTHSTIRRTFGALALASTLVFGSASAAFATPSLGASRPAVTLTDGWERQLDLARVGKPVLVVYEGKESQDQNTVIKDELAALDRTDHFRRSVLQIAIADVVPYDYWPARGIVKSELQKWSTRTGVIIYSDFSGEARRALALTPNQSNVILYGADGKVIFAAAGTLSVDQRKTLLDLVRAQIH